MNIGTAMAYLDLDITAFNSALQGAQSGLNAFSDSGVSSFDTLMNKVQNIGGAITNLGNQLTQGLTVPIVGFGTSALDAYRDAETAFTGVKKTLDISDLKGDMEAINKVYEDLENEIKNLATSTASSYEEIAGVMEIAGQLGVPRDKIAEFAKVMTMLGDSTNLTAEQASENLAKLMNITGTTWGEVENLGSAIVDLGNNFATQEDDIVLMATRLASAGTMAGLSTQEILALATAMTSVGIRAEAGGTAMSTTIAQITQMIAEAGQGSEEATEKVKILEKIMGVVPGSLQKLWKEDPMSVISAFINGLAQMDENGQETVTTLDALGMSGIRQSNMIRSLSLASDQMNTAISMSNEAWKSNTALSEEAELRYGTLDSQISQLNERWKEMKRDVAELLIPILEQLMDLAERLIDWWLQLDDSTKENIVQFGLFAAAIGPVLSFFGKIMSIGGTVIQTIGSIVKAIGGISKAFGGVIDIVKSVGSSLSGFVKNGMKLFKSFDGSIGGVVKTIGGIGLVLGGLGMSVGSFVDMWQNGFSLAEEAVMLVGLALAGIGAVLLGAPAGITAIIVAIVGIVATGIILLHDHWDEFVAWLKNLLDGFVEFWKNLWNNVVEFFGNIINSIVDYFKNLWGNITEFFGKLGTEIGSFLSDIWNIVSNFFSDIIGKIKDFISGAYENFVTFFGDLLSSVVDFIKDVFNRVVDFFRNIVNNIIDFISNVSKNIIDFLANILKNVIDFFGNCFGEVGKGIATILKAIVDFIADALKNIIDFLANILKNVIDFFADIVKRFAQFIADFIKSVIQFFVDLYNHWDEGLAKIIQIVVEFITNVVKNIVDFFADIIGKLVDFLLNIIDNIVNLGSRMFEAGKAFFGNLWEGFKEIWNGIVNWFEEKFGWLIDKARWAADQISKIIPGFSEGNMFGLAGSHRSGLDYVPYDGYVAKLHQGERVLTKQEAREYNNNTGGNSGDTYNFYNTKPDPYEYARQMKRVKRELNFG